ncbi:MAG TPA: DUF6159 family protein [Candidatus Poseidoniales archaeon]|nr:DUF6159 family protein [Candidatus Poseidoniales archaeon]
MSVVKKDPELMVYVFLSGLFSLGAMVAIAIPQFLEMGWAINGDQPTGAYWGFVFAGYMAITIIVTFFNSAIVCNSHMRLTGGDPKFSDGIKQAFGRIHLIIIWGIIAGTVGLLLKMLSSMRRDAKGGAAIAMMIIEIIGAFAWFVMSFYVIPLMVLEGKGVKESMKESKQLFFSTWGENVTSGIGIGVISFIFAVLIALSTVALMVILTDLWYVGLILGALAMIILVMWSTAAEQVSVSALYIYSKSGQMPVLFQEGGMTSFHLPGSA